MRGAASGCHVELDLQLERDFEASPTPHVILAERILRAIQGLEARRTEFDVLFLYIPSRWRELRRWPCRRLRPARHLKAVTAARRLPIQLVREDRALAYPHRASVMWRIGLALYAKAGGSAWKLAETDPKRPTSGSPTQYAHLLRSGPRFVILLQPGVRCRRRRPRVLSLMMPRR